MIIVTRRPLRVHGFRIWGSGVLDGVTSIMAARWSKIVFSCWLSYLM